MACGDPSVQRSVDAVFVRWLVERLPAAAVIAGCAYRGVYVAACFECHP